MIVTALRLKNKKTSVCVCVCVCVCTLFYIISRNSRNNKENTMLRPSLVVTLLVTVVTDKITL